MTCLTILEFPDPRLRTRATPVAAVDGSLRELIDDMLETMYAAKGIGLAATQVDVHQRVLVMDVSEERNVPRAYINPEILSRDGVETSQEGCLSVPGYRFEVVRSERVTMRGLDLNGNEIVLEGDDLLARMVQHEIDHLDGVLLLDRVEPEVRREALRDMRTRELGATASIPRTGHDRGL